MLETDALRQSIRHGDGAWDAQLRAAFEQLSQAEQRRGGLDPLEWEQANKAFHEALIAAHRSPWTKYLLSILYRQAERYRHVAIRLGAQAPLHRDVHREHTDIFQAAIARQEARAALALEAHIQLTCDLLRQAVRDDPLTPLTLPQGRSRKLKHRPETAQGHWDAAMQASRNWRPITPIRQQEAPTACPSD
jgi:DNA-binding GntR family transcriptional regulator